MAPGYLVEVSRPALGPSIPPEAGQDDPVVALGVGGEVTPGAEERGATSIIPFLVIN